MVRDIGLEFDRGLQCKMVTDITHHSVSVWLSDDGGPFSRSTPACSHVAICRLPPVKIQAFPQLECVGFRLLPNKGTPFLVRGRILFGPGHDLGPVYRLLLLVVLLWL